MKYLSLALVGILVGCGSGKGPSMVDTRTGIVLIGDSITGEWAQSYNGQEQKFTQNGWTDLGVNGNTSAQILARFMVSIPQINPKVVQIIAGTNDVNAGWVLSDTVPNIQTMVNLARQMHITVILGTIPPWGPGPIAMSEDPVNRFARIEQLNQWIVEYAADEGIMVADYHSVLEDPNGVDYGPGRYGPGLSFDGIHPSPAGYALMTAKVEQVLSAVQP